MHSLHFAAVMKERSKQCLSKEKKKKSVHVFAEMEAVHFFSKQQYLGVSC